MLSTLLQVVQISITGIEYSVWVVKGLYNTGHWIIYGIPETKEAIEIAELKQRVEDLEKMLTIN